MGGSCRYNFERPPKKRTAVPTPVSCRPLTCPTQINNNWFGDFVDPSDENLSSLSH